MIQRGTQSLKKLANNNEHKFKQKIQGKQFLMGKFEQNLRAKLARKAKKPRKLQKSKFFQIMTKQYKASQTKNLNYSNFLQLNKVWNQYIKDLIETDKNENDMVLKILRADFHGAQIQVLQSKTSSYEGISGIVIKQTLRSFVIITRDDKILTILKQNSLFLLSTTTKSFKIFGCNLTYRPSERAKHKFKSKAASQFIIRTHYQKEDKSKQ